MALWLFHREKTKIVQASKKIIGKFQDSEALYTNAH